MKDKYYMKLAIAFCLLLAACTHKTRSVSDGGGKAGPTTIDVTKPNMPDMDLTLPEDTTE